MKKTFLAALAALALTAAAACAATVGNFTARDLEGKTHTQELLGGAKLTVFNAWGTFCPPCLREMPDLGKLAEELKPEGVQVVGLLCDWFDRHGGESSAQIEKAKKIAAKTGATYLHLLLDEELLKYLGSFNAIPQTFFVAKNGEIVGAVTGAQSGDAWQKMIRDVLAKLDR